MASKPVNDLFDKYVNGDCTDSEKKTVENWYAHYLKNSVSPDVDWNQIARRSSSSFDEIVMRTSRFHNIHLWRVAAAVLFFISIGGMLTYWLSPSSSTNQKDLLSTVFPVAEPGYIKVNGQSYDLLSTENMLSLLPGSVAISTITAPLSFGNGDIYIKAPSATNYTVNLFDGSVITLNSGAELFVPTDFSLSNRRVVIEGEGFFDIAKIDKGSGRFEVDFGVHKVEVLGTKFNINTGTHQSDVRISLHTGMIKVENGVGSEVLQKGDHYIFDKLTGKYNVKKEIVQDTEVAWMQDEFVFDRRPLHAIAAELSGWYDYEILVGNTVDTSETFTGILGRNRNLQQVLDVLNSNKQYEYHVDVQERRVLIEKKVKLIATH